MGEIQLPFFVELELLLHSHGYLQKLKRFWVVKERGKRLIWEKLHWVNLKFEYLAAGEILVAKNKIKLKQSKIKFINRFQTRISKETVAMKKKKKKNANKIK